jgi:hypothetical protein
MPNTNWGYETICFGLSRMHTSPSARNLMIFFFTRINFAMEKNVSWLFGVAAVKGHVVPWKEMGVSWKYVIDDYFVIFFLDISGPPQASLVANFVSAWSAKMGLSINQYRLLYWWIRRFFLGPFHRKVIDCRETLRCTKGGTFPDQNGLLLWNCVSVCSWISDAMNALFAK